MTCLRLKTMGAYLLSKIYTRSSFYWRTAARDEQHLHNESSIHTFPGPISPHNLH